MIVKKLLVVFFMFLLACSSNTPNIEKPEEDLTGNIIWNSQRTPFQVSINHQFEFKFIGGKSTQIGDRLYDYTVFTNPEGKIIYIIDYKRLDQPFPKGADIFEPRDVNSQDILAYEPYQYSIWTGISNFSESILRDMQVDVPRCKVALNSGKLNFEDRSTAVFVVYIEPWNCARIEFEQIIDHFNDTVFIW